MNRKVSTVSCPSRALKVDSVWIYGLAGSPDGVVPTARVLRGGRGPKCPRDRGCTRAGGAYAGPPAQGGRTGGRPLPTAAGEPVGRAGGRSVRRAPPQPPASGASVEHRLRRAPGPPPVDGRARAGAATRTGAGRSSPGTPATTSTTLAANPS